MAHRVPTSQNRMEKVTFTELNDIYCHFACFGFKCLPDYDTHPGDYRGKEDQPSLELYFASPPFDA